MDSRGILTAGEADPEPCSLDLRAAGFLWWAPGSDRLAAQPRGHRTWQPTTRRGAEHMRAFCGQPGSQQKRPPTLMLRVLDLNTSPF